MEAPQSQAHLKRWRSSAPLQLRADDAGGPGVVFGDALVYGDVARSGVGLPRGMEEQFAAGAFGDLASLDAIANLMHDRSRPLARTGSGLVFTDSPKTLHVEITLPDTGSGNETAGLVRAGILRGLSLEFDPVRWDLRMNGRRIHVTRARLLGVAVVDNPAYPQSVPHLRHLSGGRRRLWL